MTRRTAIEAMVERAMERALASLVEMIYREEGLPGGVVASDEEFAHLETCIKTPKRPSSTILYGAALLQEIRPPAPRLTPEQKREKANVYMRAYTARKKAEKERGIS